MLDLNNLNQFIGTEKWYRHGLIRQVLYTDGVKYVADNGGAYWLIDVIATHQIEARISSEEFQSWEMKVKDGNGQIEVTDGDKNPILSIGPFQTNFPEPGITLWFLNNVILLPSEY